MQCQEAYEAIEDECGWTNTLAGTVAAVLGNTVVTGATGLAIILQQIAFKSAKNALKKGAESGKGCYIYVYDNAVPAIVAIT